MFIATCSEPVCAVLTPGAVITSNFQKGPGSHRLLVLTMEPFGKLSISLLSDIIRAVTTSNLSGKILELTSSNGRLLVKLLRDDGSRAL